MIFIHNAMRHPLYTYALYLPKSKRVIYRQDVIFLTNLFPMREARMKGGMNPDGEEIIAYRAPRITPEEGEDDLSFGEWNVQDKLPAFQDHVEGFTLVQPQDDTGDANVPRDAGWPNHIPHHPLFGPSSGVKVPVPGEMMMGRDSVRDHTVLELNDEKGSRRSGRNRMKTKLTNHHPDELVKPSKRRVQDRWFYETVPAILAQTTSDNKHTGLESLEMHGQGPEVCVQKAHTSLPAQAILISAHVSPRKDDEIDPSFQKTNEAGRNKSMDTNKGSAQPLLSANTSNGQKKDAVAIVQGKKFTTVSRPFAHFGIYTFRISR